MVQTNGINYQVSAVPWSEVKTGNEINNTDVVSYPININTADYETLQHITGVGETIAQRIMEYQKTNGVFTFKEQIKGVKGN